MDSDPSDLHIEEQRGCDGTAEAARRRRKGL